MPETATVTLMMQSSYATSAPCQTVTWILVTNLAVRGAAAQGDPAPALLMKAPTVMGQCKRGDHRIRSCLTMNLCGLGEVRLCGQGEAIRVVQRTNLTQLLTVLILTGSQRKRLITRPQVMSPSPPHPTMKDLNEARMSDLMTVTRFQWHALWTAL